MAETNFKIFNEANTADRTFNDSEYMNATQRQNGVIPGMALSRLHNKLYLQVSAMAKAIADFIVVQGHDCYDNDVAEITANLQAAIENVAGNNISEHNTDAGAHSNLALTVNDSLVPTKDTDTLVNLLSGLGKRFRDVTGKGNWYDAPDISLATLATLVSNLASGSDVSWSGSKFTNSKLGISGLMAQNGYIQFGPNFGGLIVQWGTISIHTLTQRVTVVDALGLFGYGISIHTLTQRVTSQWDTASRRSVYFNPHPHAEGDCWMLLLRWNKTGFQSTPSRRG